MFRLLKKSRKKENGFSLIEVLISIGLLSVISVAGTALFSMTTGMKKKMDSTAALIKIRESLVDTLRSSDALAKSSLDSANQTIPGITCLRTRQNCAAASTAFTEMTVADKDGNYLVRHTVPNFGFGVDQQPCTTYPSQACPFRFSLQWRAHCDPARPATCITPQLRVRATLNVDPNFQAVVNPERYNFDVTLGQIIGSYEQGCTSVGGTYIPSAPPRCVLAMAGDCPPAANGTLQVVVGYNRTTNTKICKPYFQDVLNGVSCAPGQVMQGVDAAGNPICKTIIDPPTDPTTPIPYCDKFPLDPICQGVDTSSPDGSAPDGGCGDGGGGGCA